MSRFGRRFYGSVCRHLFDDRASPAQDGGQVGVCSRGADQSDTLALDLRKRPAEICAAGRGRHVRGLDAAGSQRLRRLGPDHGKSRAGWQLRKCLYASCAREHNPVVLGERARIELDGFCPHGRHGVNTVAALPQRLHQRIRLPAWACRKDSDHRSPTWATKSLPNLFAALVASALIPSTRSTSLPVPSLLTPATRSLNVPCSTEARAPTGARHVPPVALNTSRSASTANRMSSSSIPATSSTKRASARRTCTASAPWPGAGATTSGSRRSSIRSCLPNRSIPAAASTSASAPPSSRRRRRVSTLPCSGTTLRSGRAASRNP